MSGYIADLPILAANVPMIIAICVCVICTAIVKADNQRELLKNEHEKRELLAWQRELEERASALKRLQDK